MSPVLHLDKGIPLVTGNSQARAFTSITTSGGKNPGATRAILIRKPRQALFKETLPPEADNFSFRIQSVSNLVVPQSLCSKEDDLCTLNLKIR
jgi:hypothetical protein